MYAGGSAVRSLCRAGARVAGMSEGFRVPRSRSPKYHREKPLTDEPSSNGASAFSMNDGSDVSHVVAGYHSSWNRIGGPPASRGNCATTAARLPPAESPATAIRLG